MPKWIESIINFIKNGLKMEISNKKTNLPKMIEKIEVIKEEKKRGILSVLENRDKDKQLTTKLIQEVEKFQEETKELDHIRKEMAYLIEHKLGGKENFLKQFKNMKS